MRTCSIFFLGNLKRNPLFPVYLIVEHKGHSLNNLKATVSEDVSIVISQIVALFLRRRYQNILLYLAFNVKI